MIALAKAANMKEETLVACAAPAARPENVRCCGHAARRRCRSAIRACCTTLRSRATPETSHGILRAQSVTSSLSCSIQPFADTRSLTDGNSLQATQKAVTGFRPGSPDRSKAWAVSRAARQNPHLAGNTARMSAATIAGELRALICTLARSWRQLHGQEDQHVVHCQHGKNCARPLSRTLHSTEKGSFG